MQRSNKSCFSLGINYITPDKFASMLFKDAHNISKVWSINDIRNVRDAHVSVSPSTHEYHPFWEKCHGFDWPVFRTSNPLAFFWLPFSSSDQNWHVKSCLKLHVLRGLLNAKVTLKHLMEGPFVLLKLDATAGAWKAPGERVRVFLNARGLARLHNFKALSIDWHPFSSSMQKSLWNFQCRRHAV